MVFDMGGLFETIAAIPDAIYGASRWPKTAAIGLFVVAVILAWFVVSEMNRSSMNTVHPKTTAEPERRIIKIGKWFMEKE